MSKFRMSPRHTPYRSTMCLPASCTMPVSALALIPHLDALIAGAGGHPAPVEVERHIVDEVLVVRRDAARHKHGRRRLPGPPPRGRRCGPQPPDHRGGTYGTSALACPPASAPARHAPRDTPCAGGACVRTSLQQQTKLGDGGWKSESTFRGQPGGVRLRKHVIRAQS